MNQLQEQQTVLGSQEESAKRHADEIGSQEEGQDGFAEAQMQKADGEKPRGDLCHEEDSFSFFHRYFS